MATQPAGPSFALIPGRTVQRILANREREVVELIESAYRLHGAGETVNPPSQFLRFPQRPTARIIALPASIGGGVDVAGIKWISSFPENVSTGLPRASAVLVLNDLQTGYPLACLEASMISASRTAASAALAAIQLGRGRAAKGRVGFVGTGLIARYIHAYLTALDWPFTEVGVYDVVPQRAGGFAEDVRQSTQCGPVRVCADLADLIRSHDVIVFATTATTPHVSSAEWFDHHPLVLNISLRDLAPEVVLGSVNVVDDVAHCLTANTSVHLAEQRTGSRDFIQGTLYDVLTGALTPPPEQTTVFSPFGLGVLDLAVANLVYQQAYATGGLEMVDGFFAGFDSYDQPAGEARCPLGQDGVRHPV